MKVGDVVVLDMGIGGKNKIKITEIGETDLKLEYDSGQKIEMTKTEYLKLRSTLEENPDLMKV
jgi:hypothetical protein